MSTGSESERWARRPVAWSSPSFLMSSVGSWNMECLQAQSVSQDRATVRPFQLDDTTALSEVSAAVFTVKWDAVGLNSTAVADDFIPHIAAFFVWAETSLKDSPLDVKVAFNSTLLREFIATALL